ncbi:hypothetical protein [Dyella sp. GSA-30]|uniref:DUF6988 family protein n=1 Tax=Dyella sp. GSA-30 TaxID=2994496 RepID=UPI002493989C|nr:hypothetical protein [Dyella sp. GSA-30]BDU22897.1 hypothetical protein DYGSA30_43540 [Dyella sp. GSA-30]
MIAELLQQSDAFQDALNEIFVTAPPPMLDEPRHDMCSVSALLAVEHGSAARLCFAANCPQAATVLMRPQFEAAVRASWLLYAASDTEIALVSGPLDEESDRLARKLPGATDMLKVLTEKAPEGLVAPLQQFHTVAWKALNSYVHTGLHPLRRRSEGYPLGLAVQAIRSGNGLLHVSYRLLAALTGSQATMTKVTRIWEAHQACLPIGA